MTWYEGLILTYIALGVLSNISWTYILGYSADWKTTLDEIVRWPLGWYRLVKQIRGYRE